MELKQLNCPMCGNSNIEQVKLGLHKCLACEGTFVTDVNISNEARLILKDANQQLNIFQDFYKAEVLFRSVIEEFGESSEAYWGLFLTEYGVNYVNDKGKCKLPTVHRLSETSVMENDDLINCLDLCSDELSTEYQSKAIEIERIRLKYIEEVKKNDPFDIFICFKKSRMDGVEGETQDAKIATQIYHELNNAGYKTFFSDITLQQKAGEDYEPIIYNALKSSKLMLLISTDKKHANAPWVRNEWSRFLKLSEEDNEKKLFVIYQNISPASLSNELAKIQGLSFDDLNFKDNLFSNINKMTFGVKNAIKRKEIEKLNLTNKATKKLDKVEIAKRDFRSGNIVIEPEAENMCDLADQSRKLGKFEKAIVQYEEALDMNKNFHKAIWGTMLAQNKIEINPSSSELINIKDYSMFDKTLAVCDEKQSKIYIEKMLISIKEARLDDKYLVFYDKYLEWASENDRVEAGKTLLKKIGEVNYLTSGNIMKFIDEGSKVVVKDNVGNYLVLLHLLGLTYLEEKRNYDIAKVIYQKILEYSEYDTEAVWAMHLIKLSVPTDDRYCGNLKLDSQIEVAEKMIQYGYKGFDRIKIMIKAIIDYSFSSDFEYGKKQFDSLIAILPKEENNFYCNSVMQYADKLIEKGDLKNATVYLNDLLTYNNKHAKSHFLLFMINNNYKNMLECLISDKDMDSDKSFLSAMKCDTINKQSYLDLIALQDKIRSSKSNKEAVSLVLDIFYNTVKYEDELGYKKIYSNNNEHVPNVNVLIKEICGYFKTMCSMPYEKIKKSSTDLSNCEIFSKRYMQVRIDLANLKKEDEKISAKNESDRKKAKIKKRKTSTQIILLILSCLLFVGIIVLYSCGLMIAQAGWVILYMIILALTIIFMGHCLYDYNEKIVRSFILFTISSLLLIGSHFYVLENRCKYELSANGFNYIVTGLNTTWINESAYDNYKMGEIEIKATHNGKPVVAIGQKAFYDRDDLISITIPDSVISIGDDAFYSCYSLTSITIPDNVTTIGRLAFYGCYNLKSIVIPNSVETIEMNAFACNNLTIYCETTFISDGWDNYWCNIASNNGVIGPKAIYLGNEWRYVNGVPKPY